MKLWTIAAALLFAIPASAQSIINGSFELPPVAENTYQTVTPTGWTGGSVIFHPGPGGSINGQPNIWPAPQDGAQYEDIGNQPSTAMSQAFAIAAPGLYEVAWYENTAIVPGALSPYTVSIFDGLNTIVTSNAFDANNAGQWDRMTLSNYLGAGTYSVEFKSTGPGGGLDTLIDNVSLTAVVPEPTSAVIFAASIALGMMSIRRR